MKNNILLILLLASFSLIAQNKRKCGFEEIQKKIKQDPNYATNELTKKNLIKNFQQNKMDTVIYIPVVIHVIYRTPAENISFAQIQSQLNVLNKDFRKFNSDTTNVAAGFSKADVKFEFNLTTKDPNGNVTTGITRTSTTVDNIGNTSQYYQLVPAWNNQRYLNIWVCDVGDFLLGFAYPPNAPGITPQEDGIVIGSEYFGTTGTVSSPYNFGRTTTHEVGHYFDLLHVWGDDQNPNCSIDDQISDTPNQDLEIYGCPSSNVSCGSNDMLSNFLQYTDDNCMGNFTLGQKNRMRMALYMSRDSLQFGSLLGLTSIPENSLSKASIFPNPSSGQFQITFQNKISADFEITVYDITGKLISFETKKLSSGYEIILETALKGFYFISLKNGNNTITKKLIKY